FKLKQRWQVSLAALLMRAKTLGRMKEATYLTAVKTASARGWRRLEPIPLGAPEQPIRLIGLLRGPASQRLRTNLPGGVITSLIAATVGEPAAGFRRRCEATCADPAGLPVPMISGRIYAVNRLAPTPLCT